MVTLVTDFGGASNIVQVPITSEDCKVSVEKTTDDFINSHRMRERVFNTLHIPSVKWSSEFSNHTFDRVLEAALGSSSTFKDAFSISAGIVERPFNTYKIFDEGMVDAWNNCRVDQLTLDISYGNIVTLNVSSVSDNYEIDIQEPTYQETLNSSPVTSSTIGGIEIEGSPSDICVSAFSFSISNNYEQRTSIDRITPVYTMGSFEITGRASIYFTPETYELYKESVENGLTTSLRVWTDHEGIVYEFYVPNADLNFLTPTEDSIDSDIILEMSFTGLYHQIFNTSFLINKYEGVSIVDIAANSLWPKA